MGFILSGCDFSVMDCGCLVDVEERSEVKLEDIKEMDSGGCGHRVGGDSDTSESDCFSYDGQTPDEGQLEGEEEQVGVVLWMNE